MGGVESDTGDLRHGDRLRGRGKAPGSVVVTNGGPEAAECKFRKYFGGGKGAELEIWQAW